MIYVASSWRNAYQPIVVDLLRGRGHDVYDFRNPAPGDNSFHWSEIDENWLRWTPEEYRKALQDTLAVEGFKKDHDAMLRSSLGVLVLPSGRSAHIEFGWLLGRGAKGIIYIPEPCEPELMYKLAHRIVIEGTELLSAVTELANG